MNPELIASTFVNPMSINPIVHAPSTVPKPPIPWIGSTVETIAKVEAKRTARNPAEMPIPMTRRYISKYRDSQIPQETNKSWIYLSDPRDLILSRLSTVSSAFAKRYFPKFHWTI